MRDSEIEDIVQVAPGLYSPVFIITHHVPDSQHKFFSIRSMDSGNRTHNIALTQGQLLYVNGALVLAEGVRRGDILGVAVRGKVSG